MFPRSKLNDLRFKLNKQGGKVEEKLQRHIYRDIVYELINKKIG